MRMRMKMKMMMRMKMKMRMMTMMITMRMKMNLQENYVLKVGGALPIYLGFHVNDQQDERWVGG